MKIYITEWTWRCGDGCCSDSGRDIECGKYSAERLPWNYGDRRELEAWIVSDMVSRNVSSCDDFREKFFASVGERYDGPDWAWSSHLQPLGEDKIRKVFADFGIPLEDIIWNEEDR